MFAVVALVVLLVAGRVTQELEWSLIGIILLLVLSAAAIMIAVDLHPALLTAVCAIVDVGLILKIFKGDLKIR
jgi:hypothetical protein